MWPSCHTPAVGEGGGSAGEGAGDRAKEPSLGVLPGGHWSSSHPCQLCH